MGAAVSVLLALIAMIDFLSIDLKKLNFLYLFLYNLVYLLNNTVKLLK